MLWYLVEDKLCLTNHKDIGTLYLLSFFWFIILRSYHLIDSFLFLIVKLFLIFFHIMIHLHMFIFFLLSSHIYSFLDFFGKNLFTCNTKNSNSSPALWIVCSPIVFLDGGFSAVECYIFLLGYFLILTYLIFIQSKVTTLNIKLLIKESLPSLVFIAFLMFVNSYP